MMSSPQKRLVLDLYCGAGGSSVGIARAGFKVIGVDIAEQPNYPHPMIKDDVTRVLERVLETGEFGWGWDYGLARVCLDDIAWIWAGPPCQAYAWCARSWVRGTGGRTKRSYPDLIAKTRTLLRRTGKPYIIENVAGAPLLRKVMLCGKMFGLGVNRHRYFESNVDLTAPVHEDCRGRIARGEAVTVAGHGGNSRSYRLDDWRRAMGIDWMTRRSRNLGDRRDPGNREDLCEAIPPAYADYLARQMAELT